MSEPDEHGRFEPPWSGDEATMLTGFLEWQRSTLAWKTRGLDDAGMRTRTARSAMTLGGIMKHMAWVEDHWFSHVLWGRDRAEPWRNVDVAAEPDWEWTSAARDSGDDIRQLWNSSCDASRDAVRDALAVGGLDQTSRRPAGGGEAPSLRWILLHMIEEYARHNGHADLLREAVDGQVGE